MDGRRRQFQLLVGASFPIKAGLHEDKKGKKRPPNLEGERAKSVSAPRSKARKAMSTTQLDWLAEPKPAEEVETLEPTPKEESTPTDQIGNWDQVICLNCGKHLLGFAVEEHTIKVHGGRIQGIGRRGNDR